VDAAQQAAALVPVIRELAGAGIAVSVETYQPEVARAGLEAGAKVLNLTGAQFQDECFDVAAQHQATVVLCYVAGDNVREITDVDLDDPFPILLDHFGARIERARSHGVERLILDPGLGFFYGNLVDPMTRVRHQARVLLSTFRLRELGLPICHALPHAFDLFEDQFRQAEAYFAVLAHLGGTSLMRTHEVASVLPVLRAMTELDV
jgi:dihydropteroate synthase